MHSHFMDHMKSRFESQRKAFASDPFPTWKVRSDRLERLQSLIDTHEKAIIRAIDADFGGRSSHETRLAELFIVRAGIKHARSHLRQWMRNRRVATGLQFRPGYNRLRPQPLGVVGIVSPWNYPFQLAMGPTLAALAAGNRVLLKPSELTPTLSALLKELIEISFDSDELAVINGDSDTGKAFAGLPFDHLFFTGSTTVGRLVAQAAAANLTPVTLELGGKSPAIIDTSCDLAHAIPRIAFGKLLNAGQTCIAPDYLLVPQGQASAAAKQLAQAIARLYPSLLTNPDYTAIISERHRQRLVSMVAEAKESGATVFEINPANERFTDQTKKLPPTLVVGARASSSLMQEEIFGPVLPIVEYRDLDYAIAFINQAERPLSLYWFGNNPANRERILQETHSGGVTINDCLWHVAQEHQPFGGVGASGMGSYHGEWGFNTFSKHKPVFHQARWSGTTLFHPPYGRTFDHLLAMLRSIA